MHTLLHTDVARQLADDRRAASRIERRTGGGTVRGALAALRGIGRQARPVQPGTATAACVSA